jgi:hypothetical protein
LELSLLLSLLVELMLLCSFLVDGVEPEDDLVVLVVVGTVGVGVAVFAGASADGKSLIHTAPATK